MRKQGSRIIGKILSPAVRLWLRSQVESVEDLQVQIAGGDRQILSGQIPHVTIAACHVVYQGIALSDVRLSGEGIGVNLREVLQGKPLQLLEVVPVQAAASFTEADLHVSLQTPLLAKALTELLMRWLPLVSDELMNDERINDERFALFASDSSDRSCKLCHLKVALKPEQIILSGRVVSSVVSSVVSGEQHSLPFAIGTGLRVVDGAKLQLDRPQWLTDSQSDRGKPLPELDGFEIDLGSDVTIEQLALTEGQIRCCGVINILP